MGWISDVWSGFVSIISPLRCQECHQKVTEETISPQQRCARCQEQYSTCERCHQEYRKASLPTILNWCSPCEQKAMINCSFCTRRFNPEFDYFGMSEKSHPPVDPTRCGHCWQQQARNQECQGCKMLFRSYYGAETCPRCQKNSWDSFLVPTSSLVSA